MKNTILETTQYNAHPLGKDHFRMITPDMEQSTNPNLVNAARLVVEYAFVEKILWMFPILRTKRIVTTPANLIAGPSRPELSTDSFIFKIEVKTPYHKTEVYYLNPSVLVGGAVSIQGTIFKKEVHRFNERAIESEYPKHFEMYRTSPESIEWIVKFVK